MQSRIRTIGALAAVSLLVPALGQADRPPGLALTPSVNGSYAFGAVAPCRTATQTFTLTNSGGSASAALSFELTGSTAFTITADSCTPGSLGPGKACSVTVVYTPSGAGQSDAATLTTDGKKDAAAASLALTGNGGGHRPGHWGHTPLVARGG